MAVTMSDTKVCVGCAFVPNQWSVTTSLTPEVARRCRWPIRVIARHPPASVYFRRYSETST